VAKVSQNRDLIHKFWNSSQLPGYFGDLGDGIHKGDANDPRVSLIEILPSEIRYWVSTKNSIGKTVQMAISSVTGKGSAPGELRIITEAEVNAFSLISQSESDRALSRSSSRKACKRLPRLERVSGCITNCNDVVSVTTHGNV
jgi:hypothetical protein